MCFPTLYDWEIIRLWEIIIGGVRKELERLCQVYSDSRTVCGVWNSFPSHSTRMRHVVLSRKPDRTGGSFVSHPRTGLTVSRASLSHANVEHDRSAWKMWERRRHHHFANMTKRKRWNAGGAWGSTDHHSLRAFRSSKRSSPRKNWQSVPQIPSFVFWLFLLPPVFDDGSEIYRRRYSSNPCVVASWSLWRRIYWSYLPGEGSSSEQRDSRDRDGQISSNELPRWLLRQNDD